MRYLKWDLEDPFRLRKLKELHLCRVQMTHVGLDNLFAALIMNKTLSMLELEQPGDDVNDAEKRVTCVRIDGYCQGQILRVLPVPFTQRLALFSAVIDHSSRVREAAEALTPKLFESIFHFAQEPERRKIIWTKFTAPVAESLIYI